MNYTDTIGYLYGLQKFGIKLGLQNTRALLAALGSPHASYGTVHVAGTNGKGSTATALAALLSALGHKCGLFTSPHMTSFTERISIDGTEITEAEVVRYAGRVREAAGGGSPTFFEVVTAMAFKYFSDQGVDFAVVETGLGGRLDSTNVITPVASVITRIAMDHAEHLGTSIAEVAAEKAGIIKPGVPVVSAPQEPEAMQAIRHAAGRAGSALHVLGEGFSCNVNRVSASGINFDYHSEGLELIDMQLPATGGAYQALNASLALKALELAAPVTDEQGPVIREGFRGLRLVGRLQRVGDDPPVFLDGAHNPAAAEALAEALPVALGGGKPVMVLGIMADKDITGILAPLLPLASDIIFATPAYGRAAPAEQLGQIARGMGYQSASAASVAEALAMARRIAKRKGLCVLVAGSFYTIGEASEALGARGVLSDLREWGAAR